MNQSFIKSAFASPDRESQQSCKVFKPRTELDLTWLSILATLITTALAIYQLIRFFLISYESQNWLTRISQPILWIIVIFYVYGCLAYQISRLGYVRRGIRHHPATLDELKQFYKTQPPSLTILVPSYKEEERVVFNTLLSVALQDYPNKRVVLLIDDPPHPKTSQDLRKLWAARHLPDRVNALLKPQARRCKMAMNALIEKRHNQSLNLRRETARLASFNAEIAAWFGDLAHSYPRVDHADALFINQVLEWHQHELQNRAKKIVSLLEYPYLEMNYDELINGYQRLVSLFLAEITSFERKRYENLSHERNKAMNLNSYIDLVGKSYQEQKIGEHIYLEQSDNDSDFSVPDADYFITLDADSLVSPDYAIRLIHFMEKPANQHIAVAQTPYSSIPNAPTAIERIAGATTDIQYIIHQGFTFFGATYWVGANALLRKTALYDIAVQDKERGFTITRYIQDRTVIEDTESSIDLVSKGWQLYNYPERLSYSATPPDFGSLIIQRRRWANGGLIILPKMRELIRQHKLSFSVISQSFLRIHYLISITAVNLGLLLWLLLPTADSLQTMWLPLSALPYFLLYMRDLHLLGYRRRDMLSVYALNLMLIPINLAGVFKSIMQMLTRRKIPFGRTPKVNHRTAAAPSFILAEYGLFFFWLSLALVDIVLGRWLDGAFGLMNASFMLYAILAFIGLKASLQDLFPWVNQRSPSKQITQSIDVSASLMSDHAS